MGVLSVLLFTGCKITEDRAEKVKDIEFTVVPADEIPEELMQEINAGKDQVMKITYEDQGYLYIVAGYGKQPTGGYSVAVDELYLTMNAIYCNTSLLAPTPGEQVAQAVSYPFVVVKMEYLDKTVVFD